MENSIASPMLISQNSI